MIAPTRYVKRAPPEVNVTIARSRIARTSVFGESRSFAQSPRQPEHIDRARRPRSPTQRENHRVVRICRSNTCAREGSRTRNYDPTHLRVNRRDFMTAEQESELDPQVALHEFRRASKHRARDATKTELRFRRDSTDAANSNDL